jgi:Zn ribbon nucleic-acid-binding protein
MADTIQIVRWALQQSCSLRQADAIHDPSAALSAVAYARTIANYIRKPRDEFGIFGDIFVTGHTYAKEPGEKKGLGHPYPSGGFVISKTFEPCGGLERILATCASCSANTRPHDPAQCCGTFYQRPSSAEAQIQLEQIVNRTGLSAQLAAAFPTTNPMWHSFWIQSPLSPDACRVLATILSEMANEDSAGTTPSGSEVPPHVPELRRFVRAAEIAADGAFALHVSLAPPGHTDFGFYTIFPHCPRCKAEAQVARWQRKYPAELLECRVCGMRFSPAETASSRRDDYERDDLHVLLGQQAFESFATEYLIAQGATPDDSRFIVAETEKMERAREADLEQKRLHRAREKMWLQAVLYTGLNVQWIKDEDDGPLEPAPMFFAVEFAELLRRAEEKSLTIVELFHRSKSSDLDRYAPRTAVTRPGDVLAKWQAEGCNELFSATIRVPDNLLG